MASWHQRYNVSGTVYCGDRLDRWCEVLRDVLGVDDVPYISHMTGDVSIILFSSIADVASSGSGVHQVHGQALQVASVCCDSEVSTFRDEYEVFFDCP